MSQPIKVEEVDASPRTESVEKPPLRPHDDSQMDHPRGPLNEQYKFFLANLPPSVTALEMRRHFESYGNVNFVKLIYNRTTGVSMGYGFLYLMDAETDRRVEEYSVRNHFRIRFANFSRIYLQRNDKTRTRPMRERPPRLPPGVQRNGEDLPPVRPSHQPRLRHGHPAGPFPPPPRRGPPRYPQPDSHAPNGYPSDPRSYDSGYYDEPEPPAAEYYPDQYAAADHYGPTGGYEDYPQSYEEVGGYNQDTHGYTEQEYSHQQSHHGYGEQQGYSNNDEGYYDGGQYNEGGDYQQGDYYEGTHSNEAYMHPQQQHSVARQEAYYENSHNQQPYPAESSYHSRQGDYDRNYAYPQDDRHLTNDHSDSIAPYGHGAYRSNSGSFRGGGRGGFSHGGRGGGARGGFSHGGRGGGARGGFSHGGRGRGGGGANYQRFQRRDRPY
ncbi:hypothetical protein FisN_8Hh181 [Fistulifera solaris]|uniref:RRM domain-containing protein n=1 Tax=Fistulifera solaris TaxID=1519565 RepID=A0A1Z5JYY0_FISSO|nr:hypothetical protein FisN_8Hh181 [Fistulifera solaris]|eukprot:GAX18961.1 hypothetical protein FisN_8Hh181 [Fistulifera solaris]